MSQKCDVNDWMLVDRSRFLQKTSHFVSLLTVGFVLTSVACVGPAKPPEPTTRVKSDPPGIPSATEGLEADVHAGETMIAVAGPPSVGIDDAPGKRERLRTAVVLFGRASSGAEELRFVPAVCSIEGKLATGKACGLAMPATARVRITRSDANSPAILTIARSTRDFHDDAGGVDYVAPAGPACCMYNTCVEETIPYLASGNAVVSSRVLAVWPETADIELKPQAQGAKRVDGPWTSRPGVSIEQFLRAGRQRLVSTRGPCGSCGALWLDHGGGFAPIGEMGAGADGFDILATTDMDGDGNAEAIVYEVWRNDYGLHVLGNDWSKIAYRFSCGNI